MAKENSSRISNSFLEKRKSRFAIAESAEIDHVKTLRVRQARKIGVATQKSS
jgi:hypothetical protein